MIKKKISFTNSLLHGFELGIILSFTYAYFEMAENFPERITDSVWQNLRALIDYWLGWVIGIIWLYLMAFTLVMGAIIHGGKHLWRYVFDRDA